MEKFANNLQLCKTSYVMQKRKELQGLLKNYQDTKKNEQKLSAYERMFLYVVNDILEGYKGIFEGDLPSVIKWCLEKDFIQQALTFCSEEMPDYFWRMGIYAPSEVEKNEYAYLIEQIRKGKVREAKSFFSNGMSKSSSKYAYNWLIKYVDKVETDKAYENFVKNASKEYREILCNNPYWKPRKEEKIEFKHFNMSNMSKDSKGMANANDKAGRLLHFISKGRVVSICQDERVLKEVIMVYFLLKDQRNNTNHASDGQKDESAWSYEIICRVLKNFVCKLEEMEK